MTLHAESGQRYHYIFLQKGSISLAPNGTIDLSIEHRCSSVLIWPEGEQLSINNTILTDPCFTPEGFRNAEQELKRLGRAFTDIGHIFITHPHGDHLPNFPYGKELARFREGTLNSFPGIRTFPCFGHAPGLHAFVFRSVSDENVWIVGDAILNLEWLKAWKYFWPNLYSRREIVQTWESVAKILLSADVVISGHGGPIYVTASLLKELLSTFPSANYADQCQNVEQFLNRRLEQLLADESKNDAEKPGKN
jgi:glyoxylase-like metal-dependent hydrolase (beta-lactamase superfamily II)